MLSDGTNWLQERSGEIKGLILAGKADNVSEADINPFVQTLPFCGRTLPVPDGEMNLHPLCKDQGAAQAGFLVDCKGTRVHTNQSG
jgi:hypothetical protein